jgi:hypothetical protein
VATARDGCVVDAAPLSEMLSGFVGSWNRDRPPTAGRFSERRTRNHLSPVGAIRWLASETGIPEGTLSNIAAKRHPAVELGVADRIVTALGCPEVLSDGEYPTNRGGTLEIRPNPLAKADARAACCGGSLTGTVAARVPSGISYELAFGLGLSRR